MNFIHNMYNYLTRITSIIKVSTLHNYVTFDINIPTLKLVKSHKLKTKTE